MLAQRREDEQDNVQRLKDNYEKFLGDLRKVVEAGNAKRNKIGDATTGEDVWSQRYRDLEQRIRSLDTTGVPLPFECFYACKVKDAAFVERQLLDAFLDHRVRSSREFFEIAPERAVAALKLAEIENITPKKDFVESKEDQQALNQARTRRAICALMFAPKASSRGNACCAGAPTER